MDLFDFVNRANADYIERLQQQYQKDPSSVPEQWRGFFAGFDLGLHRTEIGATALKDLPTAPPLSMGVFDLVHSYRELGHFQAQLDPLGAERPEHPLLHLSNFGMSDTDLDRQVGTGSFRGQTDGSLRDLIQKLRTTYCGTLGVEFTGISDKNQRDWLQDRMEPILNRPVFSPERQREILFQLVAAEEFEQYLGRVFVGAKRFSLEGGEALIPLLNTLIDHGATQGVDQVIFAMAHRGRLNVLAHVLNKPYEVMLSEFMGTGLLPAEIGGDGDVKYHLGYANHRPLPNGMIKVSLLPNPSHLELINPIQQGIVRCKQEILEDRHRTRAVPVCLHGDAAFTGQGIVAETLNLSELPGYFTGGTIHIIINNQIGFTTPPAQGRFTPYPTDIAKAIQAPIFHVNGDDPEAVVWAAMLAIEFRQRFRCDVMIDLWCYRRHGHNEQDEPTFTQPVMYRQIQQHTSVRRLYEKKLTELGRIDETELDRMKQTVLHRLDTARALAEEVRPRQKIPSFAGVWHGFGRAGDDWSAVTKVPQSVLDKVVDTLRNLPRGFTIHPKLKRLLVADRLEMVAGKKPIDWGCAEMLAIGSLLLEGTPVRLTGQDVERGTFSHRHAVLHDYENGERYVPLANIDKNQARFTVLNSMLSEFACLGFEWGYSSADPRRLVIWEAQFGDFVNGAQPIIDQILSSSESKWRYMNGLVMNLPHGYEGQGPEHSNAYLERFLSLCAEDNMQVVVPSTSAQYFHALRRQIHRKFRKPLVLMMPKKLLRYDPSGASLRDLTEGAFQNVIDDPTVTDRHQVRRLLICTGKVYYTLQAARDKNNIKDIAIVRVEQLYPFPQKELDQVLRRYRTGDIVWVQEEPKNRGAWSFMEPRLRAMLPDTVVRYEGRSAAASPATGSHKMHELEEQELISAALNLSKSDVAEVVAPGSAATAKSPTAVSG